MNSYIAHISDQDEYNLLTEQRFRVAEILRYFAYYQAFEVVLADLRSKYGVDPYFYAHYQWVINTSNSYFNSIILNECILFSVDGEKNFYKKLLQNSNILKKLNLIGITNKKSLDNYILDKARNVDFKNYCKLIRDYRTVSIAHSDNTFFHDPEISNVIEGLAKVAYGLLSLLNSVLLTYPNPPLGETDNVIGITDDGIDFDQLQKNLKKAIDRAIIWEKTM